MLREDEDGLDEEIRRAFVSLGAQPGACPSAERLVEFRNGTVATDESRAIVDHIEACGICDLLLERIKGSEEAARIGAVTIPPAEWHAIDRRLTRGFLGSLRDHGGHGDSRETPRWFQGRMEAAGALLWHPAVAYALVLILCYPAYLGIRSRPGTVPAVQREEPPSVQGQGPTTTGPAAIPAVQHARSFDLSRTRGQGGGGEAGDAVGPSPSSVRLTLSPQDRVFILTFFIPSRLDRHYSAAITGGDGRIAVGEQTLAGGGQQGGYSLVCQRESFAPGEYSLLVKEINPADGRVSRQFTFRFGL